MKEQKIEDFIVKDGEEATPIIVLTDTLEEFERFCSTTNRGIKTAIAIRQGFQIPLYPDLPIVLHGNYWLNPAYNSAEYNDRMIKSAMKEFEENNA